jgi:hypothetical protein
VYPNHSDWLQQPAAPRRRILPRCLHVSSPAAPVPPELTTPSCSYSSPGIKYNLYSGNLPPYPLPGPAVWSGYTGGGGYGGSGTATLAPGGQPTPPPGTVEKWGQCGGVNWTGGTKCVAGTTCTKLNEVRCILFLLWVSDANIACRWKYYWQCL